MPLLAQHILSEIVDRLTSSCSSYLHHDKTRAALHDEVDHLHQHQHLHQATTHISGNRSDTYTSYKKNRTHFLAPEDPAHHDVSQSLSSPCLVVRRRSKKTSLRKSSTSFQPQLPSEDQQAQISNSDANRGDNYESSLCSTSTIHLDLSVLTESQAEVVMMILHLSIF